MMKEICALFLSPSAVATTFWATKDAAQAVVPMVAANLRVSDPQVAEYPLPFLSMGVFLGDGNPLDLSDAQKRNVEQIVDLYGFVTKPYLKRIDAGRKKPLTQARGGDFDEASARSIAFGMTDDMTELMGEHEHLEVKVCSELRREQRDRAEGILCMMDELLDDSDAGPDGEAARMKASIRDALSLSEVQLNEMERILGVESVALRSTFSAGSNAQGKPRLPRLSVLFHEKESRLAARAWAMKITELFVSTGRCMARLYGVLNEEQRKDFVRLNDELETYVRCSIMMFRSPPA